MMMSDLGYHDSAKSLRASSAPEQLPSPASTCCDSETCDAPQLNNLAVSFLQTQRHEKALDFFCQAWKWHEFAAYYFNPSEQQLLTVSILSVHQASFPLQFVHNSMIVIDYHQSLIQSVPANALGGSSIVSFPDDLDLIASPSNLFSVYNRAFVFRNPKFPTLNWIQRQHLIPAVILYNMGLAYHQLALRQINANEYARASEFYRMALCIVEDNFNAGFYSSDHCILKLALYNNLGYLSSHLFNESDTIAYGGRMLATFASVDCTRFLSKEEYVFFYMNLLFLLNRHPLCAPAA